MYDEAKKLQLIEEILKIEDDEVLQEVETTLAKRKVSVDGGKTFKEFVGTMTDEEADKLQKIIEEGCETINSDDWK